MYIVGLTGGIGCGKSTVAGVLFQLDVPVIDMDFIARLLVEPGEPAWDEIKKEFGTVFLHEDGQINRQKLGDHVFRDVGARNKLNNITHPRIQARVMKDIAKLMFKGHRYVVLDSPLLIETGTYRLVQKLIVVTCDASTQMERILSRNEWSEEEVNRRIQSQIPLENKVKLADFVIENNGSLDDLKTRVEDVYGALNSSHFVWISKLFITTIAVGLFSLFAILTFVIYKIM